MRIGINLLFLLPKVVGGSETYAAGLLHTLPTVDARNEYVFFVNRESADWPLPEGARFSRVRCPVTATSRARRYAFEQLRLPALLSSHEVDLVHSLGYVSPLRTPCPSVVSVLDLNYRAFGERMTLVRRLALAFFVARSVQRSDKVITISEAAHRDILRAFGVPGEKVIVTHLAPKRFAAVSGVQKSFSGIRERFGIHLPFMLAFSSSYLNKNIPRLLQAHALVRRRDQLQHQLVLVGHAPDDAPAGWKKTDGVCVTGYLDDETLQAVLSRAEMLVFPSFYEGFGLPILEAMVLGVPVVCSNRASLPEVAGEAAVFFDPFSVEDMAVQISRVARDAALRDELRAKGYRNLERFSWEKTAARTLGVYRSMICSPARHDQ